MTTYLFASTGCYLMIVVSAATFAADWEEPPMKAMRGSVMVLLEEEDSTSEV
jgi:hypothetical protein